MLSVLRHFPFHVVSGNVTLFVFGCTITEGGDASRLLPPDEKRHSDDAYIEQVTGMVASLGASQ